MKTIPIVAFSEDLQQRIKDRLLDLNVEQDELLKVGSLLTFIRQAIRELKEFAHSYKFSDETEEIKFFKEIKPVFLSQYFYYRKVFEIRLFDSFREIKTRQANYYQELKRLERFVSRNSDFYEYCLTNMVHLDKQYFTRMSTDSRSIDRDEKSSTGYDTRLAKVMANELVKKYILGALQRSRVSMESGSGNALTWTGSKTDLIELIYALQSGDVLNNGACELKQIASVFENLFNVNLGNYYRVFQDIRLRKSGSTNFLDELKKKFNQRLAES